MTVPITLATVKANNVVSGLSRYLKQNVIHYGEQNILTFDTYIRRPFTPNGQEKVLMITKGIEYRPDLVSFDVYGTPNAWWKILEANGMSDIMEFKTGTTIILPQEFL